MDEVQDCSNFNLAERRADVGSELKRFKMSENHWITPGSILHFVNKSRSAMFANKRRRLDVRSFEGSGVPLAIFDESHLLGVRNSAAEWSDFLAAKKFGEERLSDDCVAHVAAGMNNHPVLSVVEMHIETRPLDDGRKYLEFILHGTPVFSVELVQHDANLLTARWAKIVQVVQGWVEKSAAEILLRSSQPQMIDQIFFVSVEVDGDFDAEVERLSAARSDDTEIAESSEPSLETDLVTAASMMEASLVLSETKLVGAEAKLSSKRRHVSFAPTCELVDPAGDRFAAAELDSPCSAGCVDECSKERLGKLDKTDGSTTASVMATEPMATSTPDQSLFEGDTNEHDTLCSDELSTRVEEALSTARIVDHLQADGAPLGNARIIEWVPAPDAEYDTCC
jgi:hypothetical protein